MITATLQQRQTRYCTQIERELHSIGHATNAKLLDCLRQSFPELSATTIHRATTRLASRGVIGVAPPDKDGSMQYDANTLPHDHFQCTNCGQLRDANIKERITPILESIIGDCSISGQLTINGICKKCMDNNRRKKI